MQRWEFEATGTRWAISTPDPLARSVRRAITDHVTSFENTWSRFVPTSLVGRIAAAAGGGTYPLPAGSGPMLAVCDLLHHATDGRFDPLVAARLAALGYGPQIPPGRGADRASGGSPRPTWAQCVTHTADTLTVSEPVLIDVGAVGKGALVDQISDLLTVHGHGAHLVDASGDLRVRGLAPLRIGLQDPRDPGAVIGTATVAEGSLCASSPALRTWAPGVHHILDARTGEPVSTVAATWALAPTCALADGLATALFVAPADHVLGYIAASSQISGAHIDFLVLDADRRVATSRGFPGEVFTQSGAASEQTALSQQRDAAE